MPKEPNYTKHENKTYCNPNLVPNHLCNHGGNTALDEVSGNFPRWKNNSFYL